jgi:hypothetical protein
MSERHFDEQDENPLDPEMEKVRRKMVRLLAVSIGIMFIGLMAVLAGVVYKSMSAGDAGHETAFQALQPSGDGPIRVTAHLPEGFSVEQVTADGIMLVIRGRRQDGGQAVLLFDVSTRRMVAEITLN